jgi:hypothetical protein
MKSNITKMHGQQHIKISKKSSLYHSTTTNLVSVMKMFSEIVALFRGVHKIAEMTITLVMSVCLSVRMEKLGSH